MLESILQIALLLGPPVLSLIATFRRSRYERKRGYPGRWMRLLCHISVVAAVGNLWLVAEIAVTGEGLNWRHAVAGCIAWVSLWIWIVVALQPHLHRRTALR